jgi:CheY-like chemotaxis protein
MGKRVLVADDSVTIQKAFAMVFGGQDVSILPARTYEEALSAARQGRPDLVIADHSLGGQSGYDLCAAVKADPGLRGVPVYILASGQTPYDDARGRAVGAEGAIIKPFESQSLLDKVTEALARGASASAIPTPKPTPVAAPTAGRGTPTSEVEIEEDYSDFTVERSSGATPVPSGLRESPASRPAAAPVSVPRTSPAAAPVSVPRTPPTAPPPAAPLAAGLRPSLIPGARPMPASRPTVPGPGSAGPQWAPASRTPQPSAHARAGAPASSGAPTNLSGPPVARTPAPVGRTIMGLPSVSLPSAAPGAPPRQSRPTVSPGSTAPAAVTPMPMPVTPSARTPAAAPGETTPSPTLAALTAKLDKKIDQKVATLAAKGPEYEAIVKLSREVIEQIVWEVVPELAEVIVREHVERLAAGRK